MPNGLRIEHLCHIIPKAQRWLVRNLPVFMFVYIHFNVPSTKITNVDRNASDEILTDMEHSLCLLLLCPVSYTANEYPIYHFCIIIKDFFISFSKVIIVQDFETVTFYVLFVYKPTFPVIFCLIKRVPVSRKFNRLFILYVSTAKPI